MKKCEFCNNEFDSKSSLNRHLRTARFCIKLQKEKGVEVNEKLFKCEYCSKDVTSKNLLIYHRKICKERHTYENKKEDERVKNLEDNILQLSQQLEDLENTMSTKMKELERQINIINQTEPVKYKKVQIPKSMRMIVWYTYIGRDKGTHKCLCCETNEITQGDFECAHVKAESLGGSNTVENLRPICSTCNKSMRIMNLFEYKEKYHKKSI